MGFDRQIGYGLLSIRELWVLIRNRLGGPKILWVITDYGLSQVWVKTESTVLQIVDALPVRKKLPFFREVAGSSAISAGCSLSSPLSSAVSRAEELIARSLVSGATRHVDRFSDRDKRLSLGRVAQRRSRKCATSFGRAGGTTGKQVGNASPRSPPLGRSGHKNASTKLFKLF